LQFYAPSLEKARSKSRGCFLNIYSFVLFFLLLSKKYLRKTHGKVPAWQSLKVRGPRALSGWVRQKKSVFKEVSFNCSASTQEAEAGGSQV
jgi:hypothetical protein